MKRGKAVPELNEIWDRWISCHFDKKSFVWIAFKRFLKEKEFLFLLLTFPKFVGSNQQRTGLAFKTQYLCVQTLRIKKWPVVKIHKPKNVEWDLFCRTLASRFWPSANQLYDFKQSPFSEFLNCTKIETVMLIMYI